MVKILIVSACGNERSEMLAASLAFSEPAHNKFLLRSGLDFQPIRRPLSWLVNAYSALVMIPSNPFSFTNSKRSLP
jgi:hypothetical protein